MADGDARDVERPPDRRHLAAVAVEPAVLDQLVRLGRRCHAGADADAFRKGAVERRQVGARAQRAAGACQRRRHAAVHKESVGQDGGERPRLEPVAVDRAGRDGVQVRRLRARELGLHHRAVLGRHEAQHRPLARRHHHHRAEEVLLVYLQQRALEQRERARRVFGAQLRRQPLGVRARVRRRPRQLEVAVAARQLAVVQQVDLVVAQQRRDARREGAGQRAHKIEGRARLRPLVDVVAHENQVRRRVRPAPALRRAVEVASDEAGAPHPVASAERVAVEVTDRPEGLEVVAHVREFSGRARASGFQCARTPNRQRLQPRQPRAVTVWRVALLRRCEDTAAVNEDQVFVRLRRE